MIVDCRKLNQRLRKPPRTSLCSSAAVCEVSIPSGSGLQYSSHDVCDCFYQFRIPKRLAKYLGMHPVRAGDLGIHQIDGVPISYNTYVTPILNVLPMGFSFALHWAQAAHISVLQRSGILSGPDLLVDFAPPLS